MKKSVLFTSLLVLSNLALTACGGGSDDKGASDDGSDNQIYTMVESQEMPSADPSPATDGVGSTALNNVYEGIYRLNKDNKPAPADAAEKATVSEDGLIYKVKLREESRWSDDKPITATGYVYGWQRIVDPATVSEYAYMFEPVKNIKKISKGELPKEELDIKTINDRELEITLRTVTPYFGDLLAFPSFLSRRQDIVERFGKDYTKSSDKAVCNGPFTSTELDGPGTSTKWSLTKNKGYQDKETIRLDKVAINVVKEAPTTLNLYETDEVGDTYLSDELAQQMQNSPDLVQLKVASSSYLEMSQADERSPLTNVSLHRAMSHAINRDSLARSILANGSPPSQGFVPMDVAKSPKTGEDFVKEAGSDKLIKYDKKKAVEYRNKTKQELNVSNLTVDLMVDDSEGAEEMGEYLQGSLSDTLGGLKVTMTPVSVVVRSDRTLKGNFQIAVHDWSADYSDPINFLDLLESSASNDHERYSNPEYDKFIVASKTTDVSDPEKRWEDLINAEKTVVADMDVAPICQRAESHLRAPDVKEVIYHPTDAKYDFKWAYKE